MRPQRKIHVGFTKDSFAKVICLFAKNGRLQIMTKELGQPPIHDCNITVILLQYYCNITVYLYIYVVLLPQNAINVCPCHVLR